VAKKRRKPTDNDKLVALLQDLLIATLGRAGVPQLEIRSIVGVDVVRVNRIVRHMKIRKG